jgi:hypothetical protein
VIITGRRWICVASIALTIGCTEAKTEVSKAPSRYLYVWAGMGHDSTRGIDMMTVLDANPASKGYGSVVAAVTVDSGGLMPHQTEFELPANGPLFANDYNGNMSFMIDFSDPEHPRSKGKLASIPGGRKVHSFARLANGNVLATYQFGDSSCGSSSPTISIGRDRVRKRLDRETRPLERPSASSAHWCPTERCE